MNNKPWFGVAIIAVVKLLAFVLKYMSAKIHCLKRPVNVSVLNFFKTTFFFNFC